MSNRAELIATAITNLEWLVTVPHTIDQIIGLHAESTRSTPRPLRHGMTNDEILASISGGGSGPHTSGHSDPTAMAALWGEPDATDPDETVATIDSAIALLAESVEDLEGNIATVLGVRAWYPPPQPARSASLSRTISMCHRVGPQCDLGASQAEPWQLAQIDHLIRDGLAETSQWLNHKAQAIWHGAHGDRSLVATQKPITPCANCSMWRTGTIATSGGLCQQCHVFYGHHKVKPTERIVRRWDYGKQATPPGLIAEARAAKRRRSA